MQLVLPHPPVQRSVVQVQVLCLVVLQVQCLPVPVVQVLQFVLAVVVQVLEVQCNPTRKDPGGGTRGSWGRLS